MRGLVGRQRRDLVLISLFAAITALASCTQKVALYCDEDTPCEDPARPHCDLDGSTAASEGITNTCVPTPCDGGPCCGGGQVAPRTIVCAEGEEQRCSNADCGADVEARAWMRYCDGLADSCSGEQVFSDWTTSTSCETDQLCAESGTSAQCTDCLNGCNGQACQQCESGVCCDVDGRFSAVDRVCETWSEYGCDSNVCGAVAQQRTAQRHCSGLSATCDGPTIAEPWQTLASCNSTALCDTNGTSYAQCSECEYGCADAACRPGTVFLFPTATTFTGNIGGRVGADQQCAGEYQTNFGQLGCSEVHAFLSINVNDEIRDMPAKFGVPEGTEVKLANGTVIDSSWSELFDNSIQNPMTSLFGSGWWSGSRADGSLDLYSCAAWTTASAGEQGQTGDATKTTAQWLANQGAACSVPQRILCLCW